MTQKIIRIATRKSPLALWQANYISELLIKHWPSIKIELLPMTTSGDKFIKNKLTTLGGKGLFVKELEEALLDNRADIAVHSMKDVPVTFPKGLEITAICTRQNPLDALVSENYNSLNDLPKGAIIGTMSLRRQSQLLANRPDFNIKTLRGNVQTRLAKLKNNEYDAIVLAAAGLLRLNLQAEIKAILGTEIMLPACGQGALGIECRIEDKDIIKYLKPLNDEISSICVNAERHVNAILGGNCHVPLAVYCAPINDEKLIIRAKVASVDGKIIISNSQEGKITNANELADICAKELLANGAKALLGD